MFFSYTTIHYRTQRRKKNMRLNVTLDESASKAFQEIKNHLGVTSNRSVVGLLISREEDRIVASKRRKVFLPNEVYDRAEKAAKARGQTLDEYIDEITSDLLKLKPDTEKLVLPTKTYEAVRVNSFQLGQTPSEYIERIILEHTKDQNC
jgi:predicted DNA-binding protein